MAAKIHLRNADSARMLTMCGLLSDGRWPRITGAPAEATCRSCLKNHGDRASRIVRVRMGGPSDCVWDFIRVITDAAQLGEFAIVRQQEPRQDKRGTGFAAYLTIRLPDDGDAAGRADTGREAE